MAKKMKEREEDSRVTSPLCSCKELRELRRELREHRGEPGVEEEARLKVLRGKCWAECWSCGAAMGCPSCTPRPDMNADLEGYCDRSICRVCGSCTNGLAFIMAARHMSAENFDRHPSGWRFAYWAVHGSPNPQFLPGIRNQLRIELTRRQINRVLRYLGRPEYTIDPVTGDVAG